MIRRSVEQRLWSRVSRNGDGCWNWIGKSCSGGANADYGLIYVEGKQEYTHRLSWVLANKQTIPRGLIVMHTCDNGKCVNPMHLRLGTKADNSRDMASKRRSALGVRNGQAKITENEVRAIRNNLKLGVAQHAIGKMFGVSQGLVSLINLRKVWAHVE